ncbi:MAG: AI-2E family transporter [Pseudomonadota bacterium]|nr:AI-2E family transporter [Pseudomonadota bacterium]
MLGLDLRTARIVWTAFAIALLLYLIYISRSTLLVIVFAIFFSYLLYPLIKRLERVMPRRVPRVLSIGLAFIIVIAAIGLASALLGPRIVDEATRLGQKIPQLMSDPNVANKIPLPRVLESQRTHIIGFVQGKLQEGADTALPLAKRVGTSVLHAASNLIYIVLIPVLSFLLIKEGPVIRDTVLSWMSPRYAGLWSNIADDLSFTLSKYVRALLMLSLSTLIAYGTVFSILGVPYALVLAAVAALLEFIPFVGPLAALVGTCVIAAVTGFDSLFLLFGFIVAYRAFQDYVLNPYLMSEGVEVSPLLVIVGLLLGDEIGGVAGIFLSVPVMAAIKIIVTHARASQKATALVATAGKVEMAGEAVK